MSHLMKKQPGKLFLPMWLRIRFISVWLEPVLSNSEEFSIYNKNIYKKSMELGTREVSSTGINLIILQFTVYNTIWYITNYPEINVIGCLFVPKNPANHWTDMVLLYNLASHRS